MCGIAGLIGTANPQRGAAIAKAMYHRGPDDFGVWTNTGTPPLTLISTRLAIIDLSAAGHMPMHWPEEQASENGLTIVYNGEIYNYATIRTELEQFGHRFRSGTDTEVLLAAYAQWGDACLDKLRGMFAFLLWDSGQQRLLAARDRLGIKPIYWADTPNGLVLASELKAILASGWVAPQLNHSALPYYLAYYMVPAPLTMVAGVNALLPGHKLAWQAGQVTVEEWWQLPPATPNRAPFADLKAQLRHLLEESVRLRMIADVPVGAFLSGGIDSSAIVALMTQISGRPLKTFSIGFNDEGAEIDERSFARQVATRYAADHTEVIVRGEDVAAQLPAMMRAIDQPSGDALNTYLVSQAARQVVTVALSGVGGDELFAGYPQFRLLHEAAQFEAAWRWLPNGLRRGLAQQSGRIGRVAQYANADFIGRYRRLRTLFNPAEQALLLGQTAAASDPVGAHLAGLIAPADPNIIERVARLELTNYMPNMLLRDTDAMSMAHSLEVRVPLIDHKLVEFVRTIPAHFKLRGRQTKYLLIDALRDLLPPEVITRPKRGFEMPVSNWLKGPLRPALDEALAPETVTARGLFDPTIVNDIHRQFITGENPVYLRPWSLAVVELWAQQVLDTVPIGVTE